MKDPVGIMMIEIMQPSGAALASTGLLMTTSDTLLLSDICLKKAVHVSLAMRPQIAVHSRHSTNSIRING